MREILFRGKRTDNGEWFDGFYTCVADVHYILSGIFDSLTNGIINTTGYKVIPETVSQFTGLYDKNGRKIFEGDIVLTQDYYDKPYAKNRKSKRHIGVVEYKIGSSSSFYNEVTGKWDAHKEWEAEWIVKVKHYGKFAHGDWGDFFDCEVIGNIYDNPELLEGS